VKGLVASNADGADDRGYVVPETHPLADFILDVLDHQLGTITGRNISWNKGRWRSLSQGRPGEQAQLDRGTEARKIAELFVHLATDAQRQDITAELPTTVDYQAVVERRMTAVRAVVATIKDDFLEAWEKYKRGAVDPEEEKKKKKGRKKANCGALYSRWKKVGYEKERPPQPVRDEGRVDHMLAGVKLSDPVVRHRKGRGKKGGAADMAEQPKKRQRSR
jgi:hypothetical protein